MTRQAEWFNRARARTRPAPAPQRRTVPVAGAVVTVLSALTAFLAVNPPLG